MKYALTTFSRLAVLGLLLSATASCDLLDQDSPQAFSDEDVFTNPTRIDKLATGMYDDLQYGDFLGSRALIYNDVRSDDVDQSAYFSTLSTGNISASDGYAASTWRYGYRSMYSANYMIQGLTSRNGAGLAQDRYDQYIGEAKFIRALCHFTLVNMFAQPYNYRPDHSQPGIPLQLNALDGTQAYVADSLSGRATVGRVYQVIESDLMDALNKLPESNGSNSRASKDAARGLLSRVYLYKGEYAKAAEYAGMVVNNAANPHTLQPSPGDEFFTLGGDEQNYSSETVFAIAMSQNDNPNTNAAIGQHYAPRDGHITVTPYYNALPNGDRRKNDLRGPAPANPRISYAFVERGSNKWWTRKYASFLYSGSAVSASNRGAWIPIVRLPEMLLTYAEGLVESDPSRWPEALAALNKVRDRTKPANAASYTLTSFADKDAFITAILRERRFELAFEGHRIFDLFRRGMDVPAHGVDASNPGTPQIPVLKYGSTRAILPVPPTEIARNSKLTQNEGY